MASNITAAILSGLAETYAVFIVKVFLKPLLKFLYFILSLLSLFTNQYQYYPQQIVPDDGQAFDYVIVGAGTAGCVIANRLTENPDNTVLLVDAGNLPSLATEYIGFFPLFDRTNEEWNYYSTNDGYSCQAFENKVVNLKAGKVLGGSGSISYNIFSRGTKEDYDRWANLGNEGWDWKSVLKYFKKFEFLDDVALLRSDTANLHGTDGPIHIRRPNWTDIRTKDYLNGFQQAGYDILFDINGNQSVGYGMSQINVNINRQSTAITYLRSINKRPNLKLMLNTLATKIIINKNKVATGVELLLSNGIEIKVRANKEVILSAGVYNSPKILMLSGVGPASHLTSKNIDVILDSPRVGQNLMEHPLALMTLTGADGFIESFGWNLDLFTNIELIPNPVIIGQGSLNKSRSLPDYRADILPVPAASLIVPVFFSSIYEYENELSISITKAAFEKETLLTALALFRPESRGCVRLKSNDPKELPRIRTMFYSNPRDLERHARSVEDYVRVTNTKYFRSINSKVVEPNIPQCKNLKFNTHEYWKCYVLNASGPMYNSAGTCAMGPEGKGVVDARLRVRGIDHLRVVDASVMPELPCGNSFAVVVMIAEKASDMIKEDNT